MRSTLWIAIGCVLAASGLAATAAHARSATYGAAASRACLARKGATLRPSNDQSLPASLSATERAETIVATLSDGGSPAFLFLVVGRDAAEAKATLKRLAPSMLPGPTASNSWSSTSENAAWTVTTLSGSPPGKAVHTMLLGCLTTGSARATPSAAPSRYSRSSVALCLGGAFEGAELAGLSSRLFGHPVPSSVLPHLLFSYTASNSSVNDGLGLFVIVGASHADALALRTSLERALALDPAHAAWRGAQKNVAWYGFRHRGTTARGVAAGRRLLLSCVR